MATISVTSKTLIAKVRKGDPDAWADFYETYNQFMFRFIKAHGLGDMDAENLCHDVIVGLWGKNDLGKTKFSFDPVGPAKFRTWFRKVIKNKLIDHFRKKNPSAPGEHAQFVEEHAEELENSQAGRIFNLDKERFEREFEKHWRLDLLRKALPLLEERVGPQTYRAFYLCKWDEQEPAAVALRLGIERNAVDQMAHRCLCHLRTIIKEQEEERNPKVKATERSIRKARKN